MTFETVATINTIIRNQLVNRLDWRWVVNGRKPIAGDLIGGADTMQMLSAL